MTRECALSSSRGDRHEGIRAFELGRNPRACDRARHNDVAETLAAPRYEVELRSYKVTLAPKFIHTQNAPISAAYETCAVTDKGLGGATAPVLAVGLTLGDAARPADPATSTSGCLPSSASSARRWPGGFGHLGTAEAAAMTFCLGQMVIGV